MNILLVEDDDVSAEAVARSFKKNGVPFQLTHAEDGIQALEVLRGKHPAKHIQRPMVVLLDLNMPRMNGFEFLQHLRADSDLKDLVVFVLTTSDAEEDRARAYDKNVAGYMVKAAVGPQFRKLCILLDEYNSAVSL